MGFLDSLRQTAGNAVDFLGSNTPLSGLGDFGISEAIAGGSTLNTGKAPSSALPFSTQATTGQPTNSQGQVLGASNAGGAPLPSAAGAGSGYSQGFLNSLMQQAGDGIQQQYDSTLGQLSSNADFLKQQSGDLVNQADKVYGQQSAGFDSQRVQALGDLDRSQGQIDSNRKDALSDLTGDLRSQMDSFARQLGAFGAGDSSAAGMGQYAYGRMGQQARSDIWKQASQLSDEVNVRREKVGTLFQDNLRQLNDWKVNQLDTIQNEFKSKMQQLDQAKLTADATRSQQLNDIQLQIQQQAMSTALQVDQRVQAVSQANKQWAQSQSQNLNSLQAQLGQSLQSLQFGNITSGDPMNTGVTNNANFAPAAYAQGNAGGGMVALPTNRKDETTL